MRTLRRDLGETTLTVVEATNSTAVTREAISKGIIRAVISKGETTTTSLNNRAMTRGAATTTKTKAISSRIASTKAMATTNSSIKQGIRAARIIIRTTIRRLNSSRSSSSIKATSRRTIDLTRASTTSLISVRSLALTCTSRGSSHSSRRSGLSLA
jgi:hypothetical protein